MYDHFARVADRAEIHRDVITNALDAYLGVQSNRMNKTIKTLTLMSTLMLPLNLIARIYGMNFHNMPELSWQYGYPFALALMVMVATTILLLFPSEAVVVSAPNRPRRKPLPSLHSLITEGELPPMPAVGRPVSWPQWVVVVEFARNARVAVIER